MSDPQARLSRRGAIIRATAIAVIVIGLVVIAIAIYVYSQAIGTFEVRRVALPTRIYTDAQPLAAGIEISSDTLVEKLQRLGFRESTSLQKPGDYVPGKGAIDVYTRAFHYPGGDHPAQAVHVAFDENGIVAVSAANGGDAQAASIEPELLTSILGEQLENRRPVTLDQVPKPVVDAIIATEDVRFWQHPGVDPLGVMRALFRNVKAGGVAEGGSTLTQQLVKNYYLTNERTFRRKVVEAFMAVILDAKYSKKEILEAYLNDIYLGRDRSISILGVGEAARFYFGKPVSELGIPEAAMLAAMIRAPNNYSPFNNPQRALQRRNVVLGLLRKYEKIDEAQYQAAIASPLPKKPYREKSGLSSIPYYVDRVLQEMATNYGIQDVKGRGLSIYTAIDLDWQNAAAQRLESGIASLEKSSKRLRRAKGPMQGAIVSIDVPSGEIRALVGGRNYDRSQFNRVLNAKRQVGSLFKPFAYLAAFEPSLSGQNITPATLVNDTRFVLERKYGKDWSPRNYGEEYHGVVTVREALEQSMNSASVRIGMAAGISAIIKTAHSLGVETELDNVPSIILGAVALSPIEMAQSYTTIARMGERIPLRTIRYVGDERGNAVAGAEKATPVQVFPARDVFLAVHLMEGVVNRGTAAGARNYGFRKIAAGKTGTTNDKRDAWFIGFTPQTLALAWLGFDDNTPTGLSGSDGAVPIWARYMNDITGSQPSRDFPAPPRIEFAEVDETSGGLATPYCPQNVVVNEAFKEGTAPRNLCPTHLPPPPPPVDINTLPPVQTTTGIEPAPPTVGGGFGTTTLGTTPPMFPPQTTTTPPPANTQPPANPQPPPATNTSPPPATDTRGGTEQSG